jgi:hypothetical protein
MRVKTFCLLFFFQLLIALGTRAQEGRTMLDSLAQRLKCLSAGQQQTAIYLRTSKDIYESAEDLWFKAYAVDRQQQLLTAIDQTLYIQLVRSSNDSLVWEELYPIKKGTASGQIYLDNSLPNGSYWLCAYSAHSFDKSNPEFFDVRKIEIVGNVDTLIKRRGRRTQKVDTQQIIQFHLFPEGGQLLADVINSVAFKALTANGLPCNVSGTLFENDKPIAAISSIHDGMGSFLFRPQRGKQYAVHLAAPFADSVYQLPPIQEKGLTFRLLENRDDSLFFIIYNKEPVIQPFYFRVQTRGLPSIAAAGEVKDSLVLKLPLADAPAGISEATLFDRHLRPLAERLIYLKLNRQLIIQTRLSKERVGRKEKVTLHIHTTDPNHKPVMAHLGAVIYDQLYHNPTDAKDIQTHYLLANSLRGKVHNPKYYFDTLNTNRYQALDLLLLTQGWRSYQWNEQALAARQKSKFPLLSDSIKGQLLRTNKGINKQQALMIFDAAQRDSRLITVDERGNFFLSPEEMHVSNPIYIKHFGKKEDYTVKVIDPFISLRALNPWRKAVYPFMEKPMIDKSKADPQITSLSRGGIKLEEVVITEKKESVFRDKYIGHLDSLAKYQNNTDRAHGGWLNCPAGDGEELPVEGKTYIVWTGPNAPTSHPFAFNASNTTRIVYHYPKHTEEELLKMFGITKSKGFYPHKTFYEPIYDYPEDTLGDYRNTLLWKPDIITDKNGDAKLEFFSSDINSLFFGMVEGIDESGALGKSAFYLSVSQ